jgi:hypothetical protein
MEGRKMKYHVMGSTDASKPGWTQLSEPLEIADALTALNERVIEDRGYQLEQENDGQEARPAAFMLLPEGHQL